MPFDSSTRNKLSRMVSDVRKLLTGEFAGQMQEIYGIQPDGTVIEIDKLTHLDNEEFEIARALREKIDHIAGESGMDKREVGSAINRLIHEEAFTVLNRFAALRMCEERGLIQESARAGMKSKGFLVYSTVCGSGLGTTFERYKTYLFCLFDEIAVDLGLLFDRYGGKGILFPREVVLLELLETINRADLKDLWAEDETIGWIYQYFNSKEEREAMRQASSAPRNSHELAVRNQFFTPRYVVEFLTDNTLGRIWYEMRKGETELKEKCRYLVRRPNEVFLKPGEEAEGSMQKAEGSEELSQEELLKQPVYIPHRPKKDPREIRMLDPAGGSGHFGLYAFDLFEIIYQEAWDEQYAVCRGQYAGDRGQYAEGSMQKAEEEKAEEKGGEENGREKLSGSHCMAEGNGSGGNSIQFDERISERGSLRVDQSDSTGGCLDSIEHCRGSGENIEQGISEFSVNCSRLPERSRDTDFDSSTSPISASSASGADSEFGCRSWALDQRSHECSRQEIDAESSAYRLLPTAYSSKEAFLRDIPRLILMHNIHIIDIDPRAVQIAALALWLRAQKSYNALKLKPAERPRITKTNVVCAEPMPGEIDLLKEFTASLTPRLLGQIVEIIFEKMKLAGEAGTLLKIEEEIQDTIAKAREQWLKGPSKEQGELFPELEHIEPVQGLLFDLSDITDEEFWEHAEEKILDALEAYAEQAENGHAMRRRLFAEDTAQGFAFIDLCRKRYEVVLMNPPYGTPSELSKSYLSSQYPSSWIEIYICFCERATALTPRGLIGSITSRTWMYLHKFRHFRKEVIARQRLRLVADMGNGVLDDAAVETCAHVLENNDGLVATASFFDLNSFEDKAIHLETSIQSLMESSPSVDLYIWKQKDFLRFSNLSLSYTSKPPSAESKHSIIVGKDLYSATPGLSTHDDFRFARLSWEIPALDIFKKTWSPAVYGGQSTHFYADHAMFLKWFANGAEMKAFIGAIYGSASRGIRNESCYFQPGLTFQYTGSTFRVHILPKGMLITMAGQGIFPRRHEESFALLALLNTTFATRALKLINPGRFFQSSYVNALPLSTDWEKYKDILESFGMSMFALFRQYCAFDETSSEYRFENLRSWASVSQNAESEIHKKIAEQAYELDVATASLFPSLHETKSSNENSWNLQSSDSSDLSQGLFSVLIGSTFGRWDIRIALEPSLAPRLSDPFDPLPVCSPGMLVGTDSLPARPDNVVSEQWLRKRVEGSMRYADGKWQMPENDDSLPTALCVLPTDAAYPLRISWPGLLVEDSMQYAESSMQFHKDDIVVRVREVLDVLYPGKPKDTPADSPPPTAYCLLPTDSSSLLPTAFSIEQEACSMLGVKSLRDYFRSPSGFFQDHLKRYSKSRRKAPIYWPLSTRSDSYTLWIYYHRLTDQTLYLCITDYVNPKLDNTKKDIGRLQSEIATSSPRDDLITKGGNASQRNMLEKLIDFEQELKDFRDELLRLAKLPYVPNLNDGVMITAFPLWKLFRHTSWRKDLEECWRKLETGEYDWAHVAYTMWPERVKEKCKTDKSIAIAHDLEHLYEEKATEPKKPRKSKNKTGGTLT